MSIDDVLDKVFVINLKSQKRRLNHSLNAMTTKKDFPTGEILVKIESKKKSKK